MDKPIKRLPQWHVPKTREEAIQVLEDAVWRLENFSCHFHEDFYPDQLKAILCYLKNE